MNIRGVFYCILLFALVGCHRFIDTGPPTNKSNSVVFNVYCNNGDSCRCKANKFKADTTIGFHCDVADSIKISYSRTGDALEYTNEVGMTSGYQLYGERTRIYFTRKGIPGAYINVSFSAKAKLPIQGVGCDAYMRKLGINVYEISVVLRPRVKKGIKLVPYSAQKK
jgi:hypothetical protein